MNLKSQQSIFDDVKWFDSIQAGEDRCGTYAFCKRCRKTDEYPCARAANRMENGYIRVATVYGAIRKYIYLGGIK
jgi:hypothetical protein